jgi:hypothetical protein
MKKIMLTETTECKYNIREIREMKFSDASLIRQLKDPVLDDIHFFAQIGLIKNYMLYLICFNPMQFTKKNSWRFVWKCKRLCRKEISIRQNSIFESVRVSMERYFDFFLIWCRNGLGLDIADTNDVSKNTSTAWCYGLREVIQDYFIENRKMLGGLDVMFSEK